MGTYPKTVSLKDGTDVTLRPMTPEDLDRSHRFFLSVPEEDRLYLRVDVARRENIAIRMEDTDAEERWRLVAVHDDDIVGDSILIQPQHGWAQHTGEVRCIVAEDFRGRGLGWTLLSELFQEATRRRVEILFGKAIPTETAALRIVEKLGFRREAILRNRIRTLHGERQDVFLMTVSIQDAWARMEDLMHGMDGLGRERHPRKRGAP